MNPPADGYAARLGQPADWGLNADSFAPLRDELADHLHCMNDECAEKVATKLALPKSRRALTATRIADQVYATLHRWPTKHEWREFRWLLFWYGLMILSDLAAGTANSHPYLALYQVKGELFHASGASAQALWTAWLLQGIARAGFFTAFGLSLYHAYQTGFGVLIARILQLKLIHVVLVVIAGLAFGSLIYGPAGGWGDDTGYMYLSGPAWLAAPLISGSLFALSLALFFKRKLRALSSCIALLALFLYPGGPITSHAVTVNDSWIDMGFYRLEDGTLHSETIRQRMNQTTGLIERYKPTTVRGLKIVATLPNTLELRKQYYAQTEALRKATFGDFYSYDKTINVEANLQSWSWEELDYNPYYHLRTWQGRTSQAMPHYAEGSLPGHRTNGPSRLLGPLSASGAGIGWLAAPIPILTVVGLLLLIGVMGRRSLVAFFLYLLLAGAAMILTITPFFIGRIGNDIFEFGPQGVIHSPFPGFETLMLVSWPELMHGDHGNVTLILGLILSSGVPWLLTTLFLKPTQSHTPNSGPEVAA